MVEYEGETYLTATEVARHFNISRGTCYSDLLKHLKACYLPACEKERLVLSVKS